MLKGEGWSIDLFSGAKYVLVVKDDLTHYCELIACDGLTSQRTHFKNVAMKALAHKFKRMNRDILQVMQVILRECQLAEQGGPSQPQPNTGRVTGEQVAYGAVYGFKPGECRRGGHEQGTLRKRLDIPKNLDKLRASLQVMHKERCNVSEGDFVLWSRVDERYHPKLLVTWTGLYRIKEVGEFSVVLEHLVTLELREAHTSRVKLYIEYSFEVTEEILEHVSEQGIMLKEPLQKLMHERLAMVRNYVEGVKKAREREELAMPSVSDLGVITIPAGRFNFNSQTKADCRLKFRFGKTDIPELARLLAPPDPFITKARYHATAVEAICIMLNRLAWPHRLGSMVQIFVRSREALFALSNAAKLYAYERFGHLLDWDYQRLDSHWMQRYGDAIYMQGAPLKTCIGLIDGIVRGFVVQANQRKSANMPSSTKL
ncbi:hypothetical protein H257_18092 [Aphanomyces astaci]|uniref:Uncharacterized protein n=1 Tax=Aphanomyces astaci TaxID=112090 RepID=W4FC96_APHAT|nr:hypothetical protein H257_18092 [Aphanomyces astaci]ETV65102.1 hypothetical protein H257_18092 [Aphanomyces astaci]|eukprot:XP_009845405.1 hypothetical protein H257_18092 [Aphanomyces astaci]